MDAWDKRTIENGPIQGFVGEAPEVGWSIFVHPELYSSVPALIALPASAFHRMCTIPMAEHDARGMQVMASVSTLVVTMPSDIHTG